MEDAGGPSSPSFPSAGSMGPLGGEMPPPKALPEPSSLLRWSPPTLETSAETFAKDPDPPAATPGLSSSFSPFGKGPDLESVEGGCAFPERNSWTIPETIRREGGGEEGRWNASQIPIRIPSLCAVGRESPGGPGALKNQRLRLTPAGKCDSDSVHTCPAMKLAASTYALLVTLQQS